MKHDHVARSAGVLGFVVLVIAVAITLSVHPTNTAPKTPTIIPSVSSVRPSFVLPGTTTTTAPVTVPVVVGLPGPVGPTGPQGVPGRSNQIFILVPTPTTAHTVPTATPRTTVPPPRTTTTLCVLNLCLP